MNKEELKQKLNDWGHKCQLFNETHTGFDKENILYKIYMERQGASQAGKSIQFAEEDIDYNKIDNAVMTLKPHHKQVVLCQYVTPYLKRNLNKKDSKRFKSRLFTAHRRLMLIV